MSGLAAPAGRVLQVSLGRGGVPKLPVEQAWVGRLGLDGDSVRGRTVHGGPFRAVCLFGMEAIQRLQDEGHPVEPGFVGENLTTEGIEWSVQPPGTRVKVGDTVLLELTTPANPCATQKPNFHDGRFARISVLTHPSDSRMYAMVLREGEVRPGDAVTLLPPVPDSDGARAPLFKRLDRAEQAADRRSWDAAIAAGCDVRILDDGELSAAAAPGLPGSEFNHAVGLRGLPNLLPLVLDHFRAHGTVGWLPMDEPPWAGAVADATMSVLAAPQDSIGEAPLPAGVTIRGLGPHEWQSWAQVRERAGAGGTAGEAAGIGQHLLATRGVHVLIAEQDGVPAGIGTLHLHGRTGLLREGAVVPQARGQGIHRALVAARAQLAGELGCDLVTSQAAAGSIAERALAGLGLERVALRDSYRFDPADPPADPPAGHG